ncbi:hypothetical protein ACWDX8_17195 [Streptomyces anthocyanicus]|nr:MULTISPECIES: hypothetical protein [Streptomyces]MBQ0950928.1 hypothetical protein [Streptomyces sp. RK76]MDX3322912.1 hypothetical protein [Streptomyces sp. ME03-5684b]
MTPRPSEGSRAVRSRTAPVVPPSRHEVILVSSAARCPLRGRHRMPVTHI